MKLFLNVFVGLAAAGLVFWLIGTSNAPVNSPLVLLYAAMCFVASGGSFWMMYMAIRYEKSPWLMVLLAFVP
jgi:hypothetical protein